MSRTQMLTLAFWIFLFWMLLWQFFTRDQTTGAATGGPAQRGFFVYPPTGKHAPPPTHRDGPDIQQVAYSIENDVPSNGSFTCRVTLKNVGNVKAVGVQVMVRPYRGSSNYDPDAPRSSQAVLSDDDPMSQMGQWVTFPDLAAGESSTESVTFITRPELNPGPNPKPQILFEAEKAPAQASE